MRIRYFAWVRSGIGKSEETLAKPPEVSTAGELIEWLSTKGEPYTSVLSRRAAIRVAVNHVHVKPDAAVADTDEVALFPPVTGG